MLFKVLLKDQFHDLFRYKQCAMSAVTWELRGDSSGIAWWLDYSVLHPESRLRYAQQKCVQ